MAVVSEDVENFSIVWQQKGSGSTKTSKILNVNKTSFVMRLSKHLLVYFGIPSLFKEIQISLVSPNMSNHNHIVFFIHS